MRTAITILTLALGSVMLTGQQRPQPFTKKLECASGDCALLSGAPQSAGMRSGHVRLKPGAEIGWHSTGANEESLVVLKGRGEVLIEGGAARSLEGPGYGYVPPGTRHNVRNTGTEPLEYLFIVAPAAKP